MGILFLLKSKQPADQRFEEFKRQIIEHLKSQDGKDDTAGIEEDSIEKGGYAVGTIREWKGQKHIKGADGKWRRYYNKETRGARVSIKHLIKKVESINNPEDLMKLVLLHRDRFSDDNGNPIPIVQELSKYVSERQGKLAPAAPAAAEGKTALQQAKEMANKITEMKKEAVKNGTNKVTYELNGKTRNEYYHSGRWNDRPSTVGEYKGESEKKVAASKQLKAEKETQGTADDKTVEEWEQTGADDFKAGKPRKPPYPWKGDWAVGSPESEDALNKVKAWLRGWDKANISSDAAPESEDDNKTKQRKEVMQELLDKFREINPGLTKQEEFNKLNELEHKAFLMGEKEKEKTYSALKQEFYAAEQKALDEAREKGKKERDEKNAAEAKARNDDEKKRRQEDLIEGWKSGVYDIRHVAGHLEDGEVFQGYPAEIWKEAAKDEAEYQAFKITAQELDKRQEKLFSEENKIGESEAEKHQNRSDAMKGNKNAYKGGPKPQPEKEKKAEQEETTKARKKAKMPDVEKHDRVSNMKDSTWNPNSEDYRYKDTGYIAGSRKEMVQSYIRKMARDGEQVTNESIDWTGIEENEVAAADIITKQNLMGKPDWEALQTGGLTGSAGYLINQLYKSINSKPEKATADNRYNFSRGIDAIRGRLESCKTLDDVREVCSEIKGEITGQYISAKKCPEYLELAKRQAKLKEKIIDFQKNIKKEIYKEGNPYAKAEELIRKVYPHLGIDRLVDPETGIWNGTYYTAFGEKLNKLLKEGQAEFVRKQEIIEKRNRFSIEKAQEEYFAMSKELQSIADKKSDEIHIGNDMKKAWFTLGKSFNEAVATVLEMSDMEYRSENTGWGGSLFENGYSGKKYVSNKTFANHVKKAAETKDDDFSWAEKKHTGGNAGPRKTQFELLVADKIVRKGGRKIKEHPSNAELKEMFNLRDVQLGNWVANDVKSATFHVENVAMGLADLADITGIPDNLVSLNGRLAIALGARGHNKALAHYEPVERVINITKMKGGGSLGHEWWHAFDNLIADAMTGGRYNQYLSESGAYNDLTDKQRKIVDTMLRLKRDMESSPGIQSWAQSWYEKYKEKAEKAGVKIDKIESADDHVLRVKAAFSKLVDTMMTGSAVKTKNIIYSKADYQFVNSSVGKEVLEDIVESGDFETAIKECDKYYRGIRYKDGKGVFTVSRAMPPTLKKYVAAYFGKEEGGGSMTVKTNEKTSAYFENSKKLESSPGKPYWSDIKELGARAFTAYLGDKMKDKGWENNYLAHAMDNTYYTGDQKPYPEGEERKAINAAFDELFQVVKETGAIRKAIMADFILTLQKSEGSKLDYFKKLVLAHLDTLEGEGEELKKSLIEAEAEEIKKSGRSLPVGTIRDWKGKKYIKTAPGKWKPKYDSHTRGAVMAIHAIKRKVAAAKTEHEIMQIILANRDRFNDSEGHPLPFVQELHDFIQYQADHKTKPRKAAGKKPKAAPKWENPLAKYPNIEPAQVARTIANVKYQAAVGNPKERRSMVNDLVKRFNVSKKDAEAFVDVIANATDDDRYNARKYADTLEKQQAKERIKQYKPEKKPSAKKPTAAGVDVNTLYRVAIAEFKNKVGKEDRAITYNNLALKYEREYGFDFDTVMHILDGAAKHVEMTEKMEAEQAAKNKPEEKKEKRQSKPGDKPIKKYSYDLSNEEKRGYLSQIALNAPVGSFAVLDNEQWEKGKDEWLWAGYGDRGKSAKESHENAIKEAKHFAGLRGQTVVVIESSKEYTDFYKQSEKRSGEPDKKPEEETPDTGKGSGNLKKFKEALNMATGVSMWPNNSNKTFYISVHDKDGKEIFRQDTLSMDQFGKYKQMMKDAGWNYRKVGKPDSFGSYDWDSGSWAPNNGMGDRAEEKPAPKEQDKPNKPVDEGSIKVKDTEWYKNLEKRAKDLGFSKFFELGDGEVRDLVRNGKATEAEAIKYLTDKELGFYKTEAEAKEFLDYQQTEYDLREIAAREKVNRIHDEFKSGKKSREEYLQAYKEWTTILKEPAEGKAEKVKKAVSEVLADIFN